MNEMESFAKMQKHRVIIGWLFFSMAMLIAVFVAFSWKKAFGDNPVPQAQAVVEYAIAVGGLFCAVAFSLILNYRHSTWICLPFSVALLFYFPIGTALGSYYLWYFWRFIYKREESRE